MVAGSLSASEIRLGCAIFDPLGDLNPKGMKDANRTLTLVGSYPTTSDGVVGRVLFVLPRIVVHLFPSLSEEQYNRRFGDSQPIIENSSNRSE